MRIGVYTTNAPAGTIRRRHQIVLPAPQLWQVLLKKQLGTHTYQRTRSRGKKQLGEKTARDTHISKNPFQREKTAGKNNWGHTTIVEPVPDGRVSRLKSAGEVWNSGGRAEECVRVCKGPGDAVLTGNRAEVAASEAGLDGFGGPRRFRDAT